MRKLTVLIIFVFAGVGFSGCGSQQAGRPEVIHTVGSFEKAGLAISTPDGANPTQTAASVSTPTIAIPVDPLPADAGPTTSPSADPNLPPTATADPLAGYQICTPLADILLEDLPRLISDGYHPPAVYYSDARHPAVDIAFYNWKGHRQIAGTPVQSVLPGRVAVAETDTFPMGNVVIVETRAEQLPLNLRKALDMPTDKSLYSLYAHMQEDSLRVALGQEVTACQTLGQVGKTGNTQAAHLHFETRLGPVGVTFAGFQGYIEAATAEEKSNYRAWSTSGQFRHFDPMRLLLFDIGVTPTPGPRPPRSD